MNHKRLYSAFLIANLSIAATFAASAQSAVPPVQNTGADVGSTASARDIAAVDRNIDRFCPRDTGSRIVADDNGRKPCIISGRVYTSDDIQRTGATNLADALRMLDPAIR